MKYGLFTALLACGLLLTTWSQAQEVDVDNVVVILDGSGSMRQNMSTSNVSRIAAAKQALREVINNTPQSTQIGVLAFGGNSKQWLFELGPRKDADLLTRVDKLAVGGATPLGAYVKLRADRLLQA